MRVWIDLSNSPHPLLFEPIVRDLAARGHEALLTAREHAQTVELAYQRFPDVEVIGAPGTGAGGVARTARTLTRRVVGLVRWARRARPDVALSHNSYAQICAARGLRIPTVTAMDFEHQPANHLAFRLAHRILVPEALPAERLAAQGARPGKLERFPGFKEEIYLGEIEPDPEVLAGLGVTRSEGGLVAVARSAPAGAAYHRRENPLFERCVRALDARPDVRTIVLARHPEQRRQLRALGLQRTLIPERAVDARSLLHQGDVFLGAGGTMSREAALLGVPSYSIFAGERPAVDAELERRGLLRSVRDPSELNGLAVYAPALGGADPGRLAEVRRNGELIRARFLDAVESAARLRA